MDLLKQNAKKFTLLENLTEDELNQLNEEIDKQDLMDLIEHNITQENIYRILYLYDYYQYNKHEFIEQIQFMILDRKLIIDYDKLNKEDLYNFIFCNDCLKTCKILCDLEDNIHDVICVKYLIKNNHKVLDEDTINNAAHNGHLETIKYLHELGYKCNEWAINWAAQNGHIEIIKYLHELGYKGDKYREYIINGAAENGHLEILKYLHESGYKGNEWIIRYAARNGHIETIKYLHELGYKGDERAINEAAKYGHLETLKYLHELGYKGNEWAINYAAEYGHLETIKYLHKLGYKGTEYAINCAAYYGHLETVKYLLENNYPFTQAAIDNAKTDEIKQLLTDNIHLLKNDN
jgi:ankyrin repeat protein